MIDNKLRMSGFKFEINNLDNIKEIDLLDDTQTNELTLF